MTKSLRVFILGILLASVGALFHSHAEEWSFHTIQTSESSSGSMEVIDYPAKYFFQDAGVVMMIIGGIAIALSLVAWLYPPRAD
jgi:uncharacterized membrane protein YphA (DoxX/SURF4 family)